MIFLLTGATGYIGSHIAHQLSRSGNKVFAIHRSGSKFDKCKSFEQDVIWLNHDCEDDLKKLEDVEIDVCIHSAWGGVGASERNNWAFQLSNFIFSKTLFELALRLKVKKIICLGSQAEYGQFDFQVTENFVPSPTDAYGAVKLLTLHYLRNFANSHNIEWYWLRVFSVLGTNENESWLLPQVISSLLAGNSIELTKGEQQYDYLYVSDFIARLQLVINTESDYSGVYNICSGRAVEIQNLLRLIAQKLDVSEDKLKFGALPYRENQNMYMVGSVQLFETCFGKSTLEPLEDTVAKICLEKKN